MPDTTGQPEQPNTATVPPWRLPGPDRDAIMAQRAGVMAEIEALKELITAKWTQVNALGKLAGLPPERDRGPRGS